MAGLLFLHVPTHLLTPTAGIRIFDEIGTLEMTIAQALKHLCNCIDIYSNSWGPSDDGMTVDGPGAMTRMVFKDGSREVSAYI